MLGQLIKVLILDRNKILNSNETVLNDRSTSGNVNANTRERVTKSDCGCGCCHREKIPDSLRFEFLRQVNERFGAGSEVTVILVKQTRTSENVACTSHPTKTESRANWS
jgi:hypothetical protein